MKKLNKFFRFSLCVIGGAVMIHMFSDPAFAGEAVSEWRPTYDLAMKWINFFILVFVVVKYGKGPIMRFLHSQKEELAQEIGYMEAEKDKVIAEIQKTRKALEESDQRFSTLKDRIIREGERKKQNIIEQARQQSEMMMTAAKQKVGSHILQAKQQFRAELIDTAIEMAAQHLPKQMTEQDNQKLVDLYLTSASER